MANMKEKEKEFKKQLIAEEAHRLLSTRPFEAVTMEEIARSAGCGKGTLYQYFESKEHMLNHLIFEGMEKLCKDIEEKCLYNEDVLQAVNDYLDLQFNFFLHYNQIFSSWLRYRINNNIYEELINEIQAKSERKVQMVAEIFERGIREKIIAPINSVELARIIEHIFRDCTFGFLDESKKQLDPDRVLSMLKMILSQGILIKGKINSSI